MLLAPVDEVLTIAAAAVADVRAARFIVAVVTAAVAAGADVLELVVTLNASNAELFGVLKPRFDLHALLHSLTLCAYYRAKQSCLQPKFYQFLGRLRKLLILLGI